jgi:branched-chain amino acid transport system ATP-binding protein
VALLTHTDRNPRTLAGLAEHQATSPLSVHDLTVAYDRKPVLWDVDYEAPDRSLIAIVGPNGAGKSTALKAVFSLLRIRQGRITFEGRDITGLPTAEVVRQGICFVPQTDNVFPSLSIEENLELGAYTRPERIKAGLEQVYGLFPPLRERRRQAAGTLSGGQRQMVAMGRALMLDPKLMLLDEPTAGLSPKFIGSIFEIIRTINQEGISILLVEQNAKQALSMADRGYVLQQGRNRHDDTGPGLLADREVAQMFLGG